MMKILSIFFFLFWCQKTDSGLYYVLYSQINGLFHSDLPYEQQYCGDNGLSCSCPNCNLCAYMYLYYKQFNYYKYWDIIADSSQLNPSTNSQFVYKKVSFDIYDMNTMRITVINCNKPYTMLDRFIATYIDSSFFIKCHDCIGSFAGYKIRGTISVSENTISDYRSMRVDISRVRVIIPKINHNMDCSSNFPRIPGKPPTCQYSFRMRFNGHEYYDYQYPMNNDLQTYDLTYSAFMNITPIFTKPIIFDCDLVQYDLDQYLDRMPQISFASLPHHKSHFVVLGTYKNVEVTFHFSYLSFGYVGGNSDFPSSLVKPDTFVDIDGNIVCADERYSKYPCDSNNDISICAIRNPCKNNGICKGTLTAYQCICAYGFFGKKCEFYYCRDPCVHSNCTIGNKCGDCEPGWSGSDCKTPSCNKYNPCHHGTCIIEKGKRTCVCDDGYSGNYCDFKCDSNCNNGVCKFANSITFCLCNEGWFGSVCDRQNAYEQKIFPYSRDFAIAISLIIVIGVIIIITVFFIMTKFMRGNVSSIVFNNDVDEYISKTLKVPTANMNEIAIVPSTIENGQKEDNIYLANAYDYTAANFNPASINEDNIYTAENQVLKKDNLLYDNPYDKALEDETYVYNFSKPNKVSTKKDSDETIYVNTKNTKNKSNNSIDKAKNCDNPYENNVSIDNNNNNNKTDAVYDNPYA